MKRNIQRLAAHIARYGASNLLVHTIPGTPLWLVMEKIADDLWYATLIKPLGAAHYRLGALSDAEHLALWKQLIRLDVEQRGKFLLLHKFLRKRHPTLVPARGPPE